MKNCKVTQYKNSCNNSSLETFNELAITLKSGVSDYKLSLNPPKGSTISCDNAIDTLKVRLHDDYYNFPFTIPSDDPNYTGIVIVGGNSDVPFTLTKDTTFRISGGLYGTTYITGSASAQNVNIQSNWYNKLNFIENIREIQFNSGQTYNIDKTYDLSELSFAQDLKIGINTYNNWQTKKVLKGDISALSELSNTKGIRLNNQTGVYGNINSFSKCIAAEELLLLNTGVSGTIESLIEGLFSNGVASTKKIYINAGSSNVTFNAQTLTVDTPMMAVFNSTGCVVKNRAETETLATYVSGTGWTY